MRGRKVIGTKGKNLTNAANTTSVENITLFDYVDGEKLVTNTYIVSYAPLSYSLSTLTI